MAQTTASAPTVRKQRLQGSEDAAELLSPQSVTLSASV